LSDRRRHTVQVAGIDLLTSFTSCDRRFKAGVPSFLFGLYPPPGYQKRL